MDKEISEYETKTSEVMRILRWLLNMLFKGILSCRGKMQYNVKLVSLISNVQRLKKFRIVFLEKNGKN